METGRVHTEGVHGPDEEREDHRREGRPCVVDGGSRFGHPVGPLRTETGGNQGMKDRSPKRAVGSGPLEKFPLPKKGRD